MAAELHLRQQQLASGEEDQTQDVDQAPLQVALADMPERAPGPPTVGDEDKQFAGQWSSWTFATANICTALVWAWIECLFSVYYIQPHHFTMWERQITFYFPTMVAIQVYLQVYVFSAKLKTLEFPCLGRMSAKKQQILTIIFFLMVLTSLGCFWKVHAALWHLDFIGLNFSVISPTVSKDAAQATMVWVHVMEHLMPMSGLIAMVNIIFWLWQFSFYRGIVAYFRIQEGECKSFWCLACCFPCTLAKTWRHVHEYSLAQEEARLDRLEEGLQEM